MAQLTSAERLNQIRDELNMGGKKGKKFYSGSNGKKIKNVGKYNKKKYRYRELKTRQLKKMYTDEYIQHLQSLDPDDALAELANNDIIFNMPTEKERWKTHKAYIKKQRERNKRFYDYMEKRDPWSIAQWVQYEDDFDEDWERIRKKYRKKGFDLYNDKVIQVDTDDLIKRIKKSRDLGKSINDRFLEAMGECYKGGDMPDIVNKVDEKNSRIDKQTRKLIKSLEKVNLRGVRI